MVLSTRSKPIYFRGKRCLSSMTVSSAGWSSFKKEKVEKKGQKGRRKVWPDAFDLASGAVPGHTCPC